MDTNVLVYAVDKEDPERQQAAISALGRLPSSAVVLSTQVLQEFYVTVTRKLPQPLTHDEAAREIARLADFWIVAHDVSLVVSAIDLRERVGISLWDALIVRAASSARCERILTEDLNHGQVIDGVRVEDPFSVT